jgi:N-acetylneuraminate synthase
MDCVLAVVYGATSVEKHITLDRTMYGSDQPASVEMQGLRKMVEYIRYAELTSGDGIKCPTHNEEKVKIKLRRYCDVE